MCQCVASLLPARFLAPTDNINKTNNRARRTLAGCDRKSAPCLLCGASVPVKPLAVDFRPKDCPTLCVTEHGASVPVKPLAVDFRSKDCPTTCGTEHGASVPVKPLAVDFRSKDCPTTCGTEHGASVPVRSVAVDKL